MSVRVLTRSKATLWGTEQNTDEEAPGKTEERQHQIETHVGSRSDQYRGPGGSNWVHASLVDAKAACEAEPRCVGIHYDATSKSFVKLSKLGTPDQDDDATAACKADPKCIGIHSNKTAGTFVHLRKRSTPDEEGLDKHACWQLTRGTASFSCVKVLLMCCHWVPLFFALVKSRELRTTITQCTHMYARPEITACKQSHFHKRTPFDTAFRPACTNGQTTTACLARKLSLQRQGNSKPLPRRTSARQGKNGRWMAVARCRAHL